MAATLSIPRDPKLAPRRIDAHRVLVVRLLVVVVGLAVLLPWVSPAIALGGGIVLALTLGNPFPREARAVAQRLLAGSVVGLGAGMNLSVVARVGAQGFGVAALGIAVAVGLGVGLGRVLGVSKHASLLVTLGTAICGGSAIAAAAPTIGAKDDDISVALVTVFVLNAVALFAFPVIGHAVGLDPHRFGLWCALAIHDTSSVVGAAASYGGDALEIATAAKLARALWIVPVTVVLAALNRRGLLRNGLPGAEPPAAVAKTRRPWFIAGFLAAAALVTVVPVLQPAGKIVAAVAHRGLALTLFAIGLGLTRPALRKAGVRPLLQGAVLWAALASISLAAIASGWID